MQLLQYMIMRVKHLVTFFLLLYTIFYFNFFNLTKMKYTSGENYNSKELFVSDFNNYHKNKNVIIGMLAKYKWNIVKPFFHTLSKTNYKNEIICFVLDESDSIYNTYYQKYNITPIYFSLKHPYLYNNNTHYPIPESYIYQIPHIPLDFFFYANIRFFFLNIFLQIYSNSFSYILTTDIRDMFFQSNPFIGIIVKEYIYLMKLSTAFTEMLRNVIIIITDGLFLSIHLNIY